VYRCAWLLFLFGLAGSSTAFAAGFAVSEQGAASFGLAGAATGRIDLPDRGFYNPAGFALDDGMEISLGIALIVPELTHRDPQSGVSTNAESHLATPFSATGGLGLSLEGGGALGLGVAVGVPFGASLTWPVDWEGRYEVTSIALQVFESSVSFAYGNRWRELEWAVFGGPRFLQGQVSLSKQIDAVSSDAAVDLEGAGTTFLWQIGAALRAFDDLVLGLNWRAGGRLDFTGNAHFIDVPVELTGAARDQEVSTDVDLPHRIAIGLAYDVDFGVVSLDWEYFTWSSFESFGIDFSNQDTPDVSEERDWEDRAALRIGYEHRDWGALRLPLRMRLGGAYDPTPSPARTLSPTLPDADRFLVSGGLGWTPFEPLTVDLSYGHLFLVETVAEGAETFRGIYGGRADVLSIGVTYSAW
jgi:long-chain fatty acid transport protein